MIGAIQARAGRREGAAPDVADAATATVHPVFEIGLSARRLPRALLWISLLLIGAHVGLAYYHYRVEELPWLLIQLFDMDEENNLPTWFSEFNLLVAWFLLLLQARSRRRAGDRWWPHWSFLAVGFFCLAIDEIAGIHETLNTVTEISWAIPAGIAALGIGAAMIPFLLHLPLRTRVLFALAGAIYVGGAIGVELLGNSLMGESRGHNLAYYLATATEEGMEVLGVVLMIYALLDHMRGDGTGVTAGVSVS